MLGEVLLDKEVGAEDPLERAFDKIGDAHTIAVWLREAMEVELQVPEARAAIAAVEGKLGDVDNETVKESLGKSLAALRAALASGVVHLAPAPISFEI